MINKVTCPFLEIQLLVLELQLSKFPLFWYILNSEKLLKLIKVITERKKFLEKERGGERD